MKLKKEIQNRLHVFEAMINDDVLQNNINKAIDVILSSDMLLVGGNGGSAADSSHFVGELVGRFNNITNPFPAINMMSDLAYVSAISNDIDYDSVFLQYIEAFKKFNTSYLFISTSGHSTNVILAIDKLINEYNHEKIIIITGKDVSFSDYKNILTINIPSVKTEYIQEAYLAVLHEIARGIKIKIMI